MLVVSYIKILHVFLLRQFTQTLNQFFFTYLGQTEISKIACRFDLNN